MTDPRKLLIGLFGGILVALVFAVWGSSLFPIDPRRALSLSTATIGTLTFVMFFAIAYGPERNLERAMRNAIAAASVVMYLCMVGIVTYFAPAGDVGGVGVPVTGLTKDLVDSFRSTITVVVGFYFTSAAVVEGIQLSRGTAD